ncbi:hypothetical protein [Lysinibacillus boronitolerans]|uniref:hypothetical protein n=1 Tax=Lysinibacillus boronitolerans TaxID=309788 RepID=UPI0013E30F54|nr:hypothetical protein [Lysinibacillus boronitolerans]
MSNPKKKKKNLAMDWQWAFWTMYTVVTMRVITCRLLPLITHRTKITIERVIIDDGILTTRALLIFLNRSADFKAINYHYILALFNSHIIITS